MTNTTLLSAPSTMARTDSEAEVSEHTSENEDVEELQTGADDSKMTLEQRQQKLAQLRSRMVRSPIICGVQSSLPTDSSVPPPKLTEHL